MTTWLQSYLEKYHAHLVFQRKQTQQMTKVLPIILEDTNAYNAIHLSQITYSDYTNEAVSHHKNNESMIARISYKKNKEMKMTGANFQHHIYLTHFYMCFNATVPMKLLILIHCLFKRHHIKPNKHNNQQQHQRDRNL
jgi:sulfur relay (sulfurtransferase) DsrC/TusE family protein